MGKHKGELEEGVMESTSGEPKPAGESSESGTAAETVRLVGAQALLGARGILRIEHRGEVYTLRITRNDRLILTK